MCFLIIFSLIEMNRNRCSFEDAAKGEAHSLGRPEAAIAGDVPDVRGRDCAVSNLAASTSGEIYRRLKTARCRTNKLLCNKDAAHSEPNGPQELGRSAAAEFELATRTAPLRLFMTPSVKTEKDASTPRSPNELR